MGIDLYTGELTVISSPKGLVQGLKKTTCPPMISGSGKPALTVNGSKAKVEAIITNKTSKA